MQQQSQNLTRRREALSAYGGHQKRRGRPPLLNPKISVSLRLEPCVVEKFRTTGPGWQRRMHEVLRAAILDEQSRS